MLFAIRPRWIGSARKGHTIGIVFVSDATETTAGVTVAKITFGFRSTTSRASEDNRSNQNSDLRPNRTAAIPPEKHRSFADCAPSRRHGMRSQAVWLKAAPCSERPRRSATCDRNELASVHHPTPCSWLVFPDPILACIASGKAAPWVSQAGRVVESSETRMTASVIRVVFAPYPRCPLVPRQRRNSRRPSTAVENCARLGRFKR